MFGYYECEKWIVFVDAVKAEIDVIKKWNVYMSDILELDIDPVLGKKSALKPVFRLD